MSITQETRREAYESVDLSKMEGKVLSVILCGPHSAEQIMDRLGTDNPNNDRPRLTGLARKGLIVAAGRRVNRSGRSEAVWSIKNTAPSGSNTESGAAETANQLHGEYITGKE